MLPEVISFTSYTHTTLTVISNYTQFFLYCSELKILHITSSPHHLIIAWTLNHMGFQTIYTSHSVSCAELCCYRPETGACLQYMLQLIFMNRWNLWSDLSRWLKLIQFLFLTSSHIYNISCVPDMKFSGTMDTNSSVKIILV